MTKLKGGIFITAKEIQLMNGCHLRTAYTKHRFVRESLKIKGKHLTVKQYCEFEGIDPDEVIELLNPYR
jgi:hypothetical protein